MTWTLLTSAVLFYAVLIPVNIPAPLLGLKFETDLVPGPGTQKLI